MNMHSNILILEDEPLVRLLLLSGLEQAGFTVDAAETCEEALRMARSGSFDAALFDYRLPDGVSVDILRVLRAEANALPVVLLTAESESFSRELAEELQLVAVLAKPPCMPEVLTALKPVLTRRDISSPKIDRAGSYRVWHAIRGEMDFFDQIDPELPVALDCSELDAETLPCRAEEFIRNTRGAVALCGASEPLQCRLTGINKALVCAESLEALAASSRRFSLPAERAALLASVVRNEPEDLL